jgi:2,4-dienoyl-CoA reductase-like NADH-dependent reductase (Old Yellow Enzyme family)
MSETFLLFSSIQIDKIRLRNRIVMAQGEAPLQEIIECFVEMG